MAKSPRYSIGVSISSRNEIEAFRFDLDWMQARVPLSRKQMWVSKHFDLALATCNLQFAIYAGNDHFTQHVQLVKKKKCRMCLEVLLSHSKNCSEELYASKVRIYENYYMRVF